MATIELPVREPCDLCEGMAGREERWAIIDDSDHTLTVINPWQFEVGQCCVITRRHVATLLDLSGEECGAVMVAAKRVAEALVRTYRPLGILTFQNNGVFSGQETPHFHFHVVPRQTGSDWGVGPPQLATFDGAGRKRGTSHDPGEDAQRRARVHVSARVLAETANLIRSNLPGAESIVSQPSLFELIGGLEGVQRLAHAWHQRVLADEVVSHAFSHGFHPQHTERLAAYWAEAWGGPELYSGKFGTESSVVRMHSGNGAHEEMDRRAIACFELALGDAGVQDAVLKQALLAYFTWATTVRMAGYPKHAGEVPRDLKLARWSLDGLRE